MVLNYIVSIGTNLISCLVMVFCLNKCPQFVIITNAVMGFINIVFLLCRYPKKYIPYDFILIQVIAVIVQLVLIHLLDKYTAFSIVFFSHQQRVGSLAGVIFLMVDVLTMIELILVNFLKWCHYTVKQRKALEKN